MTVSKKMKVQVGPGAGVLAGAMNVAAKRVRLPHEPKQRTKGADKVAMTVFAPRETHEKLRELATARHTSLQQIVAAAVDLWLMKEGQAFSFYPGQGDAGDVDRQVLVLDGELQRMKAGR